MCYLVIEGAAAQSKQTGSLSGGFFAYLMPSFISGHTTYKEG
nr:MAG TPA: hypothetical protein [Caudoviricetes sp.]